MIFVNSVAASKVNLVRIYVPKLLENTGLIIKISRISRS